MTIGSIIITYVIANFVYFWLAFLLIPPYLKISMTDAIISSGFVNFFVTIAIILAWLYLTYGEIRL